MPTVAQLANEAGPLGLAIASGAGGLARQISRVVRLAPDRLDASLQTGDLVLLSLAEWGSNDSGAASRLLAELGASAIAAAVVIDAQRDAVHADTEEQLTPILIPRHSIELDRMQTILLRWLAECQIVEERAAHELNEEFADLVRAGAETAEVVAHLARMTSKPAVLHDDKGRIESAFQPTTVDKPFAERELRAAIIMRSTSTSRDSKRVDRLPQWRGVNADELPSLGLTRLTAAVPREESRAGYLSLLGRPAAVTQHDRSALSAAVLALTLERARTSMFVDPDYATQPADLDVHRFGVAIEPSPRTTAERIRQRLCELAGTRGAVVRTTGGYLVGVFDAGSPPLQDWERHDLVRTWHARLSADFGPISLGYSAVHTGPVGIRMAEFHARQALISGARSMGQGHAYAHGDVHLRSFLSKTNHLTELHALQETLLGALIAHDRVEQVKLLPTLEIYLDSACVTKHTAERLRIHRNSVVYRLRRIESVAQVDLGDADTRLLLQIALRATRVMKDAQCGPGPVALSGVGETR
jgi:hypothetical protein